MTAAGSPTQRLYQTVSAQIGDLIAEGGFAAGQRLPPERDLALKLKVSRPTVREALVALEIAGLVEVRTGSGTYVSHRAPELRNSTSSIEAGPSAFELITARRIVEPAAAGEAASKATKKDLVAIAKALALCEQRWQGAHKVMLEADRLFHVRIAEATHNDMIVEIITNLWEDMFSPIFAVLSERTRLKNKKMLTLHDHRTLMSCIERGDAPGAQAAMLTHLVHAEMKLLQSDVAGTVSLRSPRKDSSARRFAATSPSLLRTGAKPDTRY